MQQVNTLVQYIRSKWDIFKLQQNLYRNGARFRVATFACKPMTLLVGRRAPEIAILVGREAPEIRPVVVVPVLLVEVPKSSPRCGVLSGPLGGSGSHLDGTVVSVVRQVGRGHVALSLS